MTIKRGECRVCGKVALLDNNCGKAKLCCEECYYNQPENQPVVIRNKPLRTNWREIDKAIKKESEAEDCMIPMRERYY